MHKAILIAALTLVSLLLGLGALWIFSIYYRVKHAPRADMFFCPKDGPILESACIRFMGVPYCPYCFGRNFKRAEREGVEAILQGRVQIDKSKFNG